LSCATRFLPGWKSLTYTKKIKGGVKKKVQGYGTIVGKNMGGTLGGISTLISLGSSIPGCASSANACSCKHSQ
jgi:hypothetical protein